VILFVPQLEVEVWCQGAAPAGAADDLAPLDRETVGRGIEIHAISAPLPLLILND
jgi:hypothetical protein